MTIWRLRTLLLEPGGRARLLLPPNCVDTIDSIWITDLAQKLPSCTFQGFDVDLAQVPPKEWLPPNVKFDGLDLFQALPQSFEGKFEYAAHHKAAVLVF